MNASNLVAASPQPLEDPTFWLLNQQVGWRAAEMQNVEIAGAALVLAPGATGGRRLSEASGSFGGLVPPAHVALDPDGALYLLDTATAELKIFDLCACRFVTLRCFSGIGAGPRQLRQARSITIGNGNLYVADTGNRCVKVFSLFGFALRALWKPPASANLAGWQPTGITCDRRGRVYVSDPAQGLIHRFSPTGRWTQFASGLGAASHLTIDCHERLVVVVGDGPEAVRAFDAAGRPATPATQPHALAAHFSRLPFAVDAQGNLDLSDLCTAQTPAGDRQHRRFDPHGNPLPDLAPITSALPAHQTQGSYISQALDSRLYRCQWHRVMLRGQLPAGAQVVVATYTAETEQTPEQILALPESAWQTRQTAYQLEKGGWDCLVRSGGGRYLWLRLVLLGTGVVTPSVEHIRVEFPRISLRRYLPAVFGAEPVSADFSDRFLAIFDTTLRSIETLIQTQARFFDPLATPAASDPKRGGDFLTWLASWVGLALDRQMPEAKRRRWVANAAGLHHLRGTREGLRHQLLLFLGMEPEALCCTTGQPKPRCQPRPANCAPVIKQPCAWQPPPLILEHFQLRRWLFLGAGRLGGQAEVWGRSIVNRSQLDENAQAGHTRLLTAQDPLRDPFHVYAHKFSVFVPARYGRNERDRRALQNLVRLAMPAHTQMNLEFVEPRLRIGFQASIGLNTVVGRYPVGVTLNETGLGAASVLGSPAQQANGPSLAIGKTARLGNTTQLD